MEKINFTISSAIIDYLDQLVFKLYTDNYFSYIEDAEQYVLDIYDAIPVVLQNQKHKPTPKELAAYGNFYVSYIANNHTAWYFFFSRKGNRVVVKHITNNHVADAGFLKHF